MVKPATPVGPSDYRILYEDGRYTPQRRGRIFGFWWTIQDVHGNGRVVSSYPFEWQAMEVIEDHMKQRKFKARGPKVREFYNTHFGLQDARSGDILDVDKERGEITAPPPPKK